MIAAHVAAQQGPDSSQSSTYLKAVEGQVNGAGPIGKEDPDSVNGYIYRYDSQESDPLPDLMVSDEYDLVSGAIHGDGSMMAYVPDQYPVSMLSSGQGMLAQSGMGPAQGPRPADLSVPWDYQAWGGDGDDGPGAWGFGAMPDPADRGISQLVSVTPEKQPIMLGPAGKPGMGWPQTVTTPPWIDIGDQTPWDVIGLGAGVMGDDGSIGQG